MRKSASSDGIKNGIASAMLSAAVALAIALAAPAALATPIEPAAENRQPHSPRGLGPDQTLGALALFKRVACSCDAPVRLGQIFERIKGRLQVFGLLPRRAFGRLLIAGEAP
jgi:hypothetical protein